MARNRSQSDDQETAPVMCAIHVNLPDVQNAMIRPYLPSAARLSLKLLQKPEL